MSAAATAVQPSEGLIGEF
jgi:kinesin family member 12